MDTFRKWLNKPKADDKSLLARFYHADHALTAVASELDSFDGRAEPERCSRLVGKLRTGQEHVLGITNQIMDELLGDERASRAFRAKFPEEVLQESLAGQLWFGAECLAAGSSILNREFESASMRPLAKAVTKSLDNVRNLLREQCLRNNTPNSPRLNLNVNDAATEQLCESLKIFDKLFAEFELRYVSAMVTVKTRQEHETQELICVLFSETVQRALTLNLLEQDQVDSFDPALMFSIPRLAIVAGLVIFDEGPLNVTDLSDGQLSEMFRPFRTLLVKIRDLLRTLSKEQLRQLERLLCTNEDVMTGSSYSQGGGGSGKANNPPPPPLPPVRSSSREEKSERVFLVNESEEEEEEDDEEEHQQSNVNVDEVSELFLNTLNVINSQQVGDSDASATTVPVSGSSSPPGATEEQQHQQIDVINDCASGYLIPNTNLGYLLQPETETALMDSFISTEDEEEEEEQDLHRRGVNGSSSTEEEDDEDEEEEGRFQCLVDHFIDNISTKSNTSTTASTGTATSTTTTSSSTGDRDRDHTSTRTSPTPSSSTSSSSSSTTNTTTTPTTSEEAEKTPKCLKGRGRKDELKEEKEKKSEEDSGLCTETNSSEDRTPESESAANSSGRVAKVEEEETKEREREEERSSAHRLLYRTYAYSWDNLESNGGGGSEGQGQGSSSSRATGEGTVAAPSSSSSSSHNRRTSGPSGRRRHHRHHHHHHGQSSGSYLRRCVAYPSTSGSGGGSGSRRISREEVDMALSSATALEDDHVVSEIAEVIKDWTKNHENLLHRLFVCIAGVADQLQTNFASDLRKILRSVFLMNVSPPEPVIDTNMRIQLGDSKASDEDQARERGGNGDGGGNNGDDLMFEFRPSENDVGSGGGGSNQSINSAEEVNAEVMGGDSVFDETRSSSGGGSPSTPIKAKQQRCSSEEQAGNNNNNINNNNNNNNLHQRPHTDPGTERQRGSHGDGGNINNGNGGPTTVTRSHSLGDTSALAQEANPAHLIRSRIRTTSSSVVDTRPQTEGESQRRTRQTLQRPPRWVPDEEAPRCMSCATLFTAFRRRHHCRHCGRVFCGICSNVSVPIPKYGFVKAVRICQGCYRNERELGTTFS